MSRPVTIVIVGRPNVGKSTLFNRLLGRRRALVHDQPGVTRDRIVEECDWWVRAKKVPVRLVDTGGLGEGLFSQEIAAQVKVALMEADAAILVLDAQAGVVPGDRELVREFKASGVLEKIPVLGVVNKVDAESHESLAMDFYELGLDQIHTASAEHGRGIDDLQAAVVDTIGALDEERAALEDGQEQESDEAEESTCERRVPRIAIVGRPNVGKSTLVNALLGEERMITSPVAGTTTDAVDSEVMLGGKPFLVMDTAGIRRKSKTEQGVEVLSVVQTKKALERADVAILLLDGEHGIIDQDEKIGGLIEEVGCSVILAINKWDTQVSNPKFTKELAAERIRSQMAYLRYAPIMFMSAKRRQGLADLGDLIEEILHQRRLKIPTHEFTEWVREEAMRNNPANARFYLCHQTGRNPPTFVFHVNDPEKIHFSLKRHFTNSLRERWGYMGTPVRLLFIEGKNRRSLPKSAAKPASKPASKSKLKPRRPTR